MADRRHPSRIWDSTECALVLIDYQQEWFDHMFEQDPKIIEYNVVALADFCRRLEMPIVLSTVAVKLGFSGPTVEALQNAVPDVEPIDRSTMNAWEDDTFVQAVEATGRRKLIMGGLLTSVCLTYPVVSALSDGYDVMFPADAVGDVSWEAHNRAADRMIQAGAIPSTVPGIIPELFRDWADPRAESARAVLEPYFTGWGKLSGLSAGMLGG